MSESSRFAPPTPSAGPDLDLPRLLGGVLCLDFVNTIEDRTGATPVDTIADYGRLIHWGQHTRQLDTWLVERLRQTAARRPEAARVAHAAAIDLRESIYRVLEQLAGGLRPEECDLDTIGAAQSVALNQARLRLDGNHVAWIWQDEPVHLERVVWPVARSAEALLTGPDLGRVKQCPGPTGGCGWFFLDTSKNQSRRWCSMDGCGSQAKMRRRHGRVRDDEPTRPD